MTLKKKTPFFVGLFVIIGSFLLVGVIIWIGASKYFKKGTIYLTYFDESVQGLQVNSKVKYRGVEVGWVKSIDIAPDNRLIEVTMIIDFEGDLEKTNIAKLEPVGLTGMVYIELDNATPEDLKRTPKLSFKPDYPVIPSVPSEIQRIVANVNKIIESIGKIDFEGISSQIKMTTKTIEMFLNDQRLKNIAGNLNETSENLLKISEQIKIITKDEKITEMIADASEVVKNTKALIVKLKSDLDAINIKNFSTKTDQLFNVVNKKVYAITLETERAMESIKRASSALEELMERLKDSPSDIIFGEPPSKDVVN
ncbi:MAG TPA: MlaD family protein [Syntrophorhabdaceae bacterium]|nr:MlaD family protein [Syntrophorhabdaceae bacterium]HPU29912.1 MlaD family protein [Syntrophorhabdaceae bacterium]